MAETLGTTEERAAEYRRLGVEATRRASESRYPDVRENYLAVARSWDQLASEAERWALILAR